MGAVVAWEDARPAEELLRDMLASVSALLGSNSDSGLEDIVKGGAVLFSRCFVFPFALEGSRGRQDRRSQIEARAV